MKIPKHGPRLKFTCDVGNAGFTSMSLEMKHLSNEEVLPMLYRVREVLSAEIERVAQFPGFLTEASMAEAVARMRKGSATKV